ncbi:hypothetical protein AtEden1_Chr2g0226021 [Arabidopsis thaliana]
MSFDEGLVYESDPDDLEYEYLGSDVESGNVGGENRSSGDDDSVVENEGDDKGDYDGSDERDDRGGDRDLRFD